MRRHLHAIATAVVIGTLTAGCIGSGDDDSDQEKTTPAEESATPEPEPEPTSAVPQGAGEGNVFLEIDGKSLAGDDWDPSCSEIEDGIVQFLAVTPPMQTVTLRIAADGSLEEFVASGQDFGPYSSDAQGAEGLEVEVTDVGFTLSGALGDGSSVNGELTCPEA